MLTEHEFREALGISAPVKKKPAYQPGPSIRVTLSVRKPDGGLPIRFVDTYPTMSELLAIIEVQKKARASGLIPWAVLSIERIT